MVAANAEVLRLRYKIRAEGSDLGVTVREAQMIASARKMRYQACGAFRI